MSIEIFLNGEKREVIDGMTLLELICSLGLAPQRLAIEHNLQIVKRERWADGSLSEGDKVEIVHFVGGGIF